MSLPVEETEVLVIGGGISGVVTAKCMRDAGFKVILLERTGDVGGLWTFKEKGYGVMKFTHINVTKQNYSFSDFPFPAHVPDYPHNAQMAKYIEDYVKHFGVDQCIKYFVQVNQVQKSDGGWRVEAERVQETDGEVKPTGEKIIYLCQFVAVATGHHAKPVMAEFSGQEKFNGKIYHSVKYNDCVHNDTIEKKIVVVGIGNSAVDVACHCASAGRCKPVYLSTRSGAWVVPNYLFGNPIDMYACRLFLWLPWRVGTFVVERVISMIHGSPYKWGLNPKMHALQTQPTVSPTMIHHIQRGEIVIKPNIKKILEKEVIFDDNTRTEADQVIVCTGYKIDLPFLSEDIQKHVFDSKTNDLKLYKNAFCPTIGHTMAFIGFVQPASGGVLSMAEMQARWWAELCSRNVLLPDPNSMVEDIRKEQNYVKSRWYKSSRHTIQRDPIIYCDEIGEMIGVKPELSKHKWIAWRLLLSSCGTSQYRLQGPGKWDKALEEVKKVPVTGFLLYGTLFTIFLLTYIVYSMFCCLFGCK